MIEVDRPERQKRRKQGKSDRIDAVEAARGALSGRCEGQAKSGDGHAEALRALLVAKRSARSTRIRTIVQLRHLMFTAPDEHAPRLILGRTAHFSTCLPTRDFVTPIRQEFRDSVEQSFGRKRLVTSTYRGTGGQGAALWCVGLSRSEQLPATAETVRVVSWGHDSVGC